MTPVQLRPATEADKPFAKEVHDAAYHDFVIREWGRWDETMQETFFNKGWVLDRAQIIVTNTAPCGYVTIIDNSDHIFISELAILPHYQGRGIGREVMQKIVDQARKEKKSVRLHVFKNNRARRLYESLGFVVVFELDKSIEMSLDNRVI